MKKLIVMLFILLFGSTSYAFTAQTKATVLKSYWRNKTQNFVLWIDGDIVETKKSIRGIRTGDNVLVSVTIDGPNKPVITIIYKILEDNPPIKQETK